MVCVSPSSPVPAAASRRSRLRLVSLGPWHGMGPAIHAVVVAQSAMRTIANSQSAVSVEAPQLSFLSSNAKQVRTLLSGRASHPLCGMCASRTWSSLGAWTADRQRHERGPCRSWTSLSAMVCQSSLPGREGSPAYMSSCM